MNQTVNYSQKLNAGSLFPNIQAKTLAGNTVNLAKPENDCDWKLVVVYRGQHCPMCTKYLNKLESFIKPLKEIGVDVIAVSADSQSQLQSYLDESLEISYPIAYGLTIEHMKQLGLYLSDPRSEKETDHVFAEPGLFVINQEGKIQVVDISNNPFVRPDIETLVNGLTWIRKPENNYPIRGMHQ
ncbi:peroxiredoxin family protein [Gayadomonas joobiniege]|uniref:peroxiredoxin family protein n=1 Tax=Gayadomonas joobiniege TaxID=1234606 RepID=UPI0003696274|nr:peroxiredoxin family protein [Gayadomonas joobiniege]